MSTNEDSAADRAHRHQVGNEVGEATGSVAGIAAGAAIGSMGGPVGTIIGGIAGAIGGWWAGRGISEAAARFTSNDDAYYHAHYESSGNRLADRAYEDVSPAYRLGHLAAHNPDYSGRNFDSIEPDLRRGWDGAASRAHGEWSQVRGYARDAYSRASGNLKSVHHLSDEANDAAEEDSKRIDDVAGYRPF